MNRILALTLALLMLTAALLGCSNNTVDVETTDAATETTEPVTEATTEAVTEPPSVVGDDVDPLLAKIARKIESSEQYLIFSVGDSLTEGYNASDMRSKDFTGLFAKKLGELLSDKTITRIDGTKNSDKSAVIYPKRGISVQKGTKGEITVVRSGISGNTVQKIINRSSDFIDKEIDGRKGDLFIISCGINDSAKSKPEQYATPNQYKDNLNTLIDMILEKHPEADIILMTPTYTGNTGASLDTYATAMKQLAKSRNLALIDMHKLWMDHWVEGAENYGQGDWLCDGKNDSCHPSDIGHEAMADEMIRCLFGEKKD